MCLETSNSLRLSSLAHSLDCLTNSHSNRPPFDILVESNEHAGVHCGSEVKQQVMALVQQSIFQVQARVNQHKHSTQGRSFGMLSIFPRVPPPRRGNHTRHTVYFCDVVHSQPRRLRDIGFRSISTVVDGEPSSGRRRNQNVTVSLHPGQSWAWAETAAARAFACHVAVMQAHLCVRAQRCEVP